MKKLGLYIMLFLLIACGEDNSTASDSSVGDGQGGSLARFSLKGDYLYTVDSQKINVFNIKNTENPIQVNSLNIGFDIETLFNYKNYMFIGSQDAMYIYDVTNPELPKELSRSEHFRSCDPVVANDENAYVTLHSGAQCGGSVNVLKVYDIKDIENPVLLNERGLNAPKGLSLYGENYLLVCDGDVKIFDISNTEDSRYLKSIPVIGAIDIIIKNNHVFVIGENSIEQYLLKSSDIENFTKISSFSF